MKALRVLVIEDDALIAMLLAELLAGMGHEVCATATSEAEAVIAAACYAPDLMIVDAGFGQGSGVSAVEEILRAGPLAHVFVSGDAESVRLRRCDAIVSANPSVKLNSPEPLIWLSRLPLSPVKSVKSERLRGSRHGHRNSRAGRCRRCCDPTSKLPRQRLDNARAEASSDGCIGQPCADSHPVVRDSEAPCEIR